MYRYEKRYIYIPTALQILIYHAYFFSHRFPIELFRPSAPLHAGLKYQLHPVLGQKPAYPSPVRLLRR
jgi:hypothetical protein